MLIQSFTLKSQHLLVGTWLLDIGGIIVMEEGCQ